MHEVRKDRQKTVNEWRNKKAWNTYTVTDEHSQERRKREDGSTPTEIMLANAEFHSTKIIE